MTKADTIARIALTLPEKPTSGDVLRALGLAFDGGHIEGHLAGFTAAIENQTRTMDLVFGALSPKTAA